MRRHLLADRAADAAAAAGHHGHLAGKIEHLRVGHICVSPLFRVSQDVLRLQIGCDHAPGARSPQVAGVDTGNARTMRDCHPRGRGSGTSDLEHATAGHVRRADILRLVASSAAHVGLCPLRAALLGSPDRQRPRPPRRWIWRRSRSSSARSRSGGRHLPISVPRIETSATAWPVRADALVVAPHVGEATISGEARIGVAPKIETPRQRTDLQCQSHTTACARARLATDEANHVKLRRKAALDSRGILATPGSVPTRSPMRPTCRACRSTRSRRRKVAFAPCC